MWYQKLSEDVKTFLEFRLILTGVKHIEQGKEQREIHFSYQFQDGDHDTDFSDYS